MTPWPVGDERTGTRDWAPVRRWIGTAGERVPWSTTPGPADRRRLLLDQPAGALNWRISTEHVTECLISGVRAVAKDRLRGERVCSEASCRNDTARLVTCSLWTSTAGPRCKTLV